MICPTRHVEQVGPIQKASGSECIDGDKYFRLVLSGVSEWWGPMVHRVSRRRTGTASEVASVGRRRVHPSDSDVAVLDLPADA